MKKKWNYELAIRYGDVSPHPNGTSMYFDDLVDAFRKMLSLDRRSLLRHIDGQKISSVTINNMEDRNTFMEIKLLKSKGNINDNYIETPGIYYHFPIGINDFQRRSGIDLAYFKAADQQRSIILAAYLIEENGLDLRPTIAHEALVVREGGKERENVPYHIAMTRKYFGEGRERERKVYPISYKEEYYYPDLNTALKDFLGIEYNKLDESVAWEKGLDFFIVSSKLIERNVDEIAELLSRRTGILRIGQAALSEPGIYISGDTKLEQFFSGLTLVAIKGVSFYSRIYKVGSYNELRSEASLEQELGKHLRKSKVPSTPTPVQKKLPKPLKVVPAKRRGKGL